MNLGNEKEIAEVFKAIDSQIVNSEKQGWGMAEKHQDVMITEVLLLCVVSDCVCRRLSGIEVRGHFSVCAVAEKCALNPNNYIYGWKKHQHL